LEGAAVNHRSVLSQYTVAYLDTLIMIVAASTLLTYAVYTCSPEVVARVGTDKLYLTIPFVVIGLFRYLHLVQHHMGGGDPSRALLKDAALAVTVVLWGLSCVVILYNDIVFV
jgi:decaprenyl-phosphate phosphoribosyltransferase